MTQKQIEETRRELMELDIPEWMIQIIVKCMIEQDEEEARH